MPMHRPKCLDLYCRYSHEHVARTEELLEGRVWVDYDHDGKPVGVEVLGLISVDMPAEPPPPATP